MRAYFSALFAAFLIAPAVGLSQQELTRPAEKEEPSCIVPSRWEGSLECFVLKPSDVTPKAGVLLVHMLGGKKEHFLPLAKRLKKAGFCSLGFDLPGHPPPLDDEEKADWRTFGISHFRKMVFDVEAAWKEMIKMCSLQDSKAYAVGAELGANLLIEAVLKKKINPEGVVLLSPALSIKGLDAFSRLKQTPWPENISTLIFTDTYHTYFLFSARKLKELMGEDRVREKELRTFAIGTYLLREDFSVSDEIVNFFNNLSQ